MTTLDTKGEKLRIGVIGLGRGFMTMVGEFVAHPELAIRAAADPRPEARERFVSEFGGSAYAEAEAVCADPSIDAVYIATPHQFHVAHVKMAAKHGKHVLVEKPMALTLEDCQAMIDATEAAGVHMVVGRTHSSNGPVRKAREIVRSGELGALRMIHAFDYTDFLYRPRRPEELQTSQGGGVIYNQAPHQVDVIRYIAGGMVKSVRAMAGNWDPQRPTEGSYSALLQFEGGAFGTITYSGYAHFDSDEFMGWVAERGTPKNADQYGAVRRALGKVASADQELKLKNEGGYGARSLSDTSNARQPLHPHFGVVIASCDRGDLRPVPQGVLVHGDLVRSLEPAPFGRSGTPRSAILDELCDAVVHDIPPPHDGRWAMGTMEVCLAILKSSQEGREITLAKQCPLRD